MENQNVDAFACERLSKFLHASHSQGTPSQLAFLHLSPWGEHIFRKNAQGKAVIDAEVRKAEKKLYLNRLLNTQEACRFALAPAVEHRSDVMRNPVNIRLVNAAARRALS